MQDLNDKITGGVLTAAEWNEVPSEIQNVIEKTGITLSGGDLDQLGKAVANYVGSGDFYTDSGAADAYVLATVGAKQAPSAYVNGMRIRFVAGNDNTGASTVNVAGLGVISLKNEGGTALSLGDIQAGISYEFYYDGAGFVLGTINHAFARGSVLRFIPQSLHAAIRAKTDGTDLTAYLQNWLDSSIIGDELSAPNGLYNYVGLTITKAIKIEGDGSRVTASDGNGTTFNKIATSTSIGFDLTATGIALESLSVTGTAGNTNVGIRCKGGRPILKSVSVFNQGGDGIRLGTDAADNVNLWYMERIITDGNGGHGVHVHSNTGSPPDVNGGVLNFLDSRNNAGDGLYVNNAWINTFIGITAQTNTGYGINCSGNSKNNKFYGGDQDEFNAAGNVNNAGVGNVFIGIQPGAGLTDTGTTTGYFSGGDSYTHTMGLGATKAITSTALQEGKVGFAGTEVIQKWVNTGNAAANRGYSLEYDLPASGSAALGVKIVIARSGTNESSYWAVQVKRDGVSLADTFKLDADNTAGNTRMLVYDVDNGTLERVSVGAADSGGVGYKALRIPN